MYNGRGAGVGPRVQKALIFHYILCTRTCRGHTMLASPTPDVHHCLPPRRPRKSFTAFDYFSAPPLRYSRALTCVYMRIPCIPLYHYHCAATIPSLYHRYTATAALYTITAMYVYTHTHTYIHTYTTTTTNTYVYNICEGIVKKKKIAQVRER
jgi:hypothetical protein